MPREARANLCLRSCPRKDHSIQTGSRKCLSNERQAMEVPLGRERAPTELDVWSKEGPSNGDSWREERTRRHNACRAYESSGTDKKKRPDRAGSDQVRFTTEPAPSISSRSRGLHLTPERIKISFDQTAGPLPVLYKGRAHYEIKWYVSLLHR